MIGEINKLLNPLRRKLLLILGKAIVTAVNDDGELQQLQTTILKSEIKDRIDRYQNYGFTSNPLPGAQAVAVFNGGNRQSGIVLAVDDARYRVKNLKPGEVAIYTDEGDSITLHRNRHIKIRTKKFELDTEDCQIKTAKFSVTNGTIDITVLLIQWMNEIITATTSTMLGPMKLVGAGLPNLKAKLEKFKS